MLAPYFLKARHHLLQAEFMLLHAARASALPTACAPAQQWDAAEGLLYVCRKLLSQPYIAPVLSALLYQWMLTHKDAGGAEQRQKHVNLLVAGSPSLALSVFAPLVPLLAIPCSSNNAAAPRHAG